MQINHCLEPLALSALLRATHPCSATSMRHRGQPSTVESWEKVWVLFPIWFDDVWCEMSWQLKTHAFLLIAVFFSFVPRCETQIRDCLVSQPTFRARCGFVLSRTTGVQPCRDSRWEFSRFINESSSIYQYHHPSLQIRYCCHYSYWTLFDAYDSDCCHYCSYRYINHSPSNFLLRHCGIIYQLGIQHQFGINSTSQLSKRRPFRWPFRLTRAPSCQVCTELGWAGP